MTNTMENTKTKVLIAEDLRTSRMIIERLLTRWGFEPVLCEDGLQAQEALAKPDGPRIAILDWMMPGKTGPEICAWIGKELDAFVYTILLTSKTEREDMLIGLTAGAHAYITKPTDPTELEAQIKVGLRILGYESELAYKSEELRRYATQMETLAEDRARQLVHADRMVTLGTMSAGIAHEINNSATLLSGNVQTLEKFWPVVQQSLEQSAGESGADSRLDFILEEVPNILGGMRKGVVRISKIVKGLKTYSHREKSDDLEPVQINDAIHSSLELCENALKRTATTKLKLASDLPEVMAAAHQLEQVFVNMIVNACDAMRPKAPGEITVTTRHEDDEIVVVFEDTGPGIPAEILEKIWDPFYTTKGIGKGTGLGLSISLGIIDNHGGSYRVENRDEGGARF
ncbi:MAG: ATP-binding protein, partial [Candidatus Hydrogenedentes bacterium]|nr:ATP-binding protein [Candidatus Hydrogenedentota bacterium]